MANLPIPSNSGRNSLKQRMAPRIDFTPMVDLGFLLITFFMLSTTLAKPNMMAVVMPDTSGTPEPTKASRAITLLLGAENKVYWYEGLEMNQLDSTSYESEGLRKVLLNKMEKLQAQFGLQTFTDPKTGETRNGSFLNVLIKPGEQASYKNLVDALDEMNICHVRYYCILDPTTQETAHMR